MILSVKNKDHGKVFDCNGKHIDDSIMECNLETGEAVRQILCKAGRPQEDPKNPGHVLKETVVYENTPLTFERFEKELEE